MSGTASGSGGNWQNGGRPYNVSSENNNNWGFTIAQSQPPPSHHQPGPGAPPPALSPPGQQPPLTNRYQAYSDYSDLNGNTHPAPGTMLRAFITSSLLSFTSTALVMPFEVGKTLAQVQWVPRDGLDPQVYYHPGQQQDEQDEEAVELEDEAEAEAYFSDLQSRGASSFAPPTDSLPRPVSPSGYLTRTGVSDEAFGTKPEWTMPIVVQGGVWDMIKTVGRWKGEGWASLWKGQLTTCCLDASTGFVQPFLLSAFSVALLPTTSYALSALPIIHSPRPGPLLFFSTLSHALTTVLFSPIDLVRTRLIVQSAQPQHRKYSGPIDALRTITREEGGLWTTYLHPNLLVPALLEGVLRPLIHLSTPLIISRVLHIEPSTSPIWFGLAEFVIGSMGLLITIPIETVRKRLQIQTRAEFVRGGRPNGTGKAWRTCVETRPAPYAGVVEAVYRILTEETGRIPRRRRRSSALPSGSSGKGKEAAADAAAHEEEREDLAQHGLGVGSGLRQLYRGLGMGIGANAVVFLLGLVAGGDDSSGWAEM
ncbi:mitochondrial carrier [Meredithblackwellia eburnea MCA 4105]